MVKWRINTLSPQEIATYRQRSVRAINGLNYCKQNAHIIAQYEKVADKYKTIASYIGLGQEGGNSYYNLFVPTNKNIVFLLRNANHNNLNPSLYDMHEQLGRPNKRFVIFFKNGNTFSDAPVVFQESEHHVIPYNVNALDNEASIVAYIDALIKLFTKGKTKFPILPIVTENKLHTNMNKKLIRLTEGDLHKIVKESVNRLLSEGHFDVRNYRWGKMGSKLNKPLSDIDKEKVDVAKLARYIYPDHTPQTAKDFMLRKLYGESNLHRIVKESVGKILREIRYGGESLHGNNGVDWYALHNIRGFRNDLKYDGESYTPENLKDRRNYTNACTLDKDIHDGGQHHEDLRSYRQRSQKSPREHSWV